MGWATVEVFFSEAHLVTLAAELSVKHLKFLSSKASIGFGRHPKAIFGDLDWSSNIGADLRGQSG
jgi:hypothetical protein